MPGLVHGVVSGLTYNALTHSDATIAEIDARGAKAVIAQHPRRIQPLRIDREMYI